MYHTMGLNLQDLWRFLVLVLGTLFVLLKIPTFFKKLKVNTIILQHHQIQPLIHADASRGSIADGIDLALSMLVHVHA